MRLEMTRKADLACRALVALDKAGGRLKAAEIAERVDATSGFIPQVLGPLVDMGWLSSGHGPTGGYELAVDLDDVSVLDVVEAIDGPTDTGRCVVSGRVCNESEPCPLHVAWASARTALMAELDATALSHLTA